MYIFCPGEKEWTEIVAVKKTVSNKRKLANGFIFIHLCASKFLTKVVLKIASF